jgi:hypothetical protein
MRWAGIAAALLSLGSAVYGVLSAQADLREHNRDVAEQLAAARTQAAAADYQGAWESLQRANATAAVDGIFAKLLGGLSAQRRAVRTAQEDLAMEWIRGAHAPEGHTFSEIADKVAIVLAQGADSSAGSRKADLLAHLGWAYFLKQREGNTQLRPELQYQQAIAVDPDNPYANVFWGHYVLWHSGPLSEAERLFASAVKTPRARAVVRDFQLAALNLSYNLDLQTAWWRVLDEMHKQGEPIGEHWQHEMARMYQSALEDDSEGRWLMSVIPVTDHLELQRMLLKSDPDDKLTVMAAMAAALEAAGRNDDALAAWREVQSFLALTGKPSITVRRAMDAALKRMNAKTTNQLRREATPIKNQVAELPGDRAGAEVSEVNEADGPLNGNQSGRTGRLLLGRFPTFRLLAADTLNCRGLYNRACAMGAGKRLKLTIAPP